MKDLCLLFSFLFFAISCEKELPTESRSNHPIVTIHYLPESIDPYSSENILFMAKVRDPQGVTNIKQVHIEFFQQDQRIHSGVMWDNGQHGDIIANNGTFTYAIQPRQLSFTLGEAVVKFLAEDYDGNKSPEIKDTVMVKEIVTNEAPKINDVNGPALISRSQGGLYVLTATVSDPQGFDDIQRVFFNSFLPDGSPSSGNPFQMYDTGTNGDAAAGDGIYSFQFTIGANNSLGEYRFEIQAQDKAGARSAIAVFTITVVQ